MRVLGAATAIAAVLAAAGAAAQEFELDLQFDEEITFEEVPEAEPASGMQVSALLSFSALRSPAGSNDTRALTLRFADSHDLGALGFLEWSASLLFPDLAAAAPAEFSLDRLVLQNSAGDLSWQLGKYRIGWGEIEGIAVLDVLNPALSLATVGNDSAQMPGQWFASAEYFAGVLTVSGFVGPDPQVEHLLPAAADNPPPEFGVKADIPFEGGQASLYAARLVPQAGVVDLVTMTSSARPYRLIGISAHRAFGPVLLEFDLALKSGLERASATGLVLHDRLDAAVGAEIALSNTAQLSASVSARRWLRQDQPYFDFGPGGAVPAGRTTSSYLLGVSNSFPNNDFNLSFNLGGALDGSLMAAVLSADYSLSDRLRLSARASAMRADPAGLFGPFDGTRSLGLEAEFFF